MDPGILVPTVPETSQSCETLAACTLLDILVLESLCQLSNSLLQLEEAPVRCLQKARDPQVQLVETSVQVTAQLCTASRPQRT